jgi:hypothetical protein
MRFSQQTIRTALDRLQSQGTSQDLFQSAWHSVRSDGSVDERTIGGQRLADLCVEIAGRPRKQEETER